MSKADIQHADRLALRWTIGNVRDRGFEMLRLSIACAYRLFGPLPKYVVCVNSVLLEINLHVRAPVRLGSEIQEQGLQAAAIFRNKPVFLGRTTEVSLCSPFWPRSPEFGTCGAQFPGMNARHFPGNYYDRPADEWLERHWHGKRGLLYQNAGFSIADLPEADRAENFDT